MWFACKTESHTCSCSCALTWLTCTHLIFVEQQWPVVYELIRVFVRFSSPFLAAFFWRWEARCTILAQSDSSCKRCSTMIATSWRACQVACLVYLLCSLVAARDLEIWDDPVVQKAAIRALGSLEAARRVLENGKILEFRDRNESFKVLIPQEDPSLAADCQNTFAQDTYRLRFWAAEQGLQQLLEIGANVGCWSLYAAKVMGMEVMAVEPNKHAALFLHYNLAMNQLQSQVTVLEGAVVAREAMAETKRFCNPGLGDLQGGAVQDPHETRADLCVDEVPAYDLEELIQRLQHVSILKMNCEGCEVETLADVQPAVLKEQVSRVSMEIFEDHPDISRYLTHPKTAWLLKLMCTDMIWSADHRLAAHNVCNCSKVVAAIQSERGTTKHQLPVFNVVNV
eukprot:Skav205435  [mRNA]  locus=scaffold2500:168594:171873:+ [translate_table: standard]